ncbi:sigma factor [Lignipirellula cremea]|uniref:sigma factor n=1 Tax=Lignipirellula cremea TaxID=2528010 RepID=UPI0018D235F7
MCRCRNFPVNLTGNRGICRHGNTASARAGRTVCGAADRQSAAVAAVRQVAAPGDAAAQDVAQQTSARIWEKRADFQPGAHFKAWAFSIARFEVLNYRKQQVRDVISSSASSAARSSKR